MFQRNLNQGPPTGISRVKGGLRLTSGLFAEHRGKGVVMLSTGNDDIKIKVIPVVGEFLQFAGFPANEFFKEFMEDGGLFILGEVEQRAPFHHLRVHNHIIKAPVPVIGLDLEMIPVLMEGKIP